MRDDEFSLQKLAAGVNPLDIPPYPWQYIQNEATLLSIRQHSEFNLKHWFILPSSLTGTVYLNDKAIQIFTSSEMKNGIGSLQFVDHEKSDIHCLSGEIDYEDGEIKLHWNAFVPGNHKLVVSYEYDYTKGQEFQYLRK